MNEDEAEEGLPVQRSLESLAASVAADRLVLTSLLAVLAERGRLSRHDLAMIFAMSQAKLEAAAPSLASAGELISNRIEARALQALRDMAKSVGLTPPRES